MSARSCGGFGEEGLVGTLVPKNSNFNESNRGFHYIPNLPIIVASDIYGIRVHICKSSLLRMR